MDYPSILIKITGVVLFAWTARNFYKHLKHKHADRANNANAQSVSEQVFNNLLLYLWLAFMTAFSLGMIFNN